MIDLVKALRNRATWETATGITEPNEHIDWMAADEITRLREENARLREALEPFADGVDCYTETATDEYPVDYGHFFLGHLRAAAAAIREGGKDA